MARVLIVEDDPSLSKMIADYLRVEQHEVLVASDGFEGLQLMRTSEMDVVVLDWNLPSMSGIDVAAKYRQQGGECKILMLTAKSNTADKVFGLDSGVDDYVVKPIDLEELGARLRALIRRDAYGKGLLKAGDVVLDANEHVVTCGGVEVELMPKEFAILEFLLRNPGRVFSAEALLARIWPSDTDTTAEAVAIAISRLRKKVGRDGLIRTIYGAGYKLERRE